jgi:hypothetical protein
MKTRELMAAREAKIAEARKLNETAEAELRDFTPDEQTRWDALQDEIKSFDPRQRPR